MRKSKKLQRVLLIALSLVMVLSACGNGQRAHTTNSDSSEKIESAEGKTLSVILATDVFESRDGSGITEYKQIGDVQAIVASSYEKIIKDFEEETGAQVNLLAYGTGIKEASSCDVVILDASRLAGSDAGYATNIPYMNEEYCYDLTQFFEEDGLLDSDDYISSVLKAGEIEGKRYVFPLSFNMSMLFTSEQSLARHSLSISRDQTFDELVLEFETAYRSAVDTMPLYQYGYHSFAKPTEDPYDFGFRRAMGASPIQTFTEASGQEFASEESSIYGQMQSLYEAFVASDLNTSLALLRNSTNLDDVIDASLVEGINSLIRNQQVGVFDEIVTKVACFTSTDAQAESIPFAAQAMFYESKYRELNEDFVCIAIPQKNSMTSYAAMATTYGVVPVKAKEPELGYQLLKYIADHQTSPTHDLSVNRNCVEKTLESLTNDTISIANGSGSVEYAMNPMSQETSEYLLGVIDHIGYAYFLDPAVENPLWDNMDRRMIGQ